MKKFLKKASILLTLLVVTGYTFCSSICCIDFADPRYGVYDDWEYVKSVGNNTEEIQFGLDALWQDIQICYESIVNGTIILGGEVQTMSSPDTVTYYTGTIEEALNAGYLLDHLQWFYDTGSIPASFVPSSSTPTQNTPDTGSTSDSSGGSDNTSGSSTGNNTGTTSTSSKPKEITEDSSVAGDYVTTDESTVYSDYNGNSTKDSIANGTDIAVDAETSNGYYKTTYNDDTAYIKNSNAVSKEDYEAAWEETDRVEPTCKEEGIVTYKNSLSGLEKEETIPKLEHDYVSVEKTDTTCTKDGKEVFSCSVCGDEKTEIIKATGHTEGEWEVVKEAGVFTNGEKQKTCVDCGEVLESEIIKSTIPSIVVVIVIVIIACIVAASLFVLLNKHKRRI